MGFTPLEGLVMGTRCGILTRPLYFPDGKMNLSASDMNNYLNKKSGMLGLSGVSNDLRDVLEAAEAGNERAKLALDVYISRVRAI